MGADEVSTLRDLTQRRATLDGLIASHRGRIANTAGDSLLAEFGSAVDAVQCAVETQAALTEANAGLSPDRHINFRIGVHVGDVMIKGGDLFGDGVNIAARLQTIASAGGTCISGVAHDQVRKILPLVFTDLGAQQVKNIEEPVRAFAVSAKGATAVVVSSNASVPLALPDKPSIAVLPFQNMSGDPEQEYFADGMVEDVITALSRFKSLFVIARNSSFTFKGRAVDVKQVGRELGVRYVLEGSVRKGGTKVRITSQLIDAATGGHLWADRFDGELENVFNLQDQVTASVVGQIAPKMEQAEIERTKRKPTESLGAYDYLLRGMANRHRLTKEASKEALQQFCKAIELDPDFAAAYGWAAVIYVFRNQNFWMNNPRQEVLEALRLARRAAELGRDDAVALSSAACTLSFLGFEHDVAAKLIDQALLLNPNSADSWQISGWVRLHLGEHEIAIEHLERAMRLNPLDPDTVQIALGFSVAMCCAGRYDESISWAEKALQERTKFVPALRSSVVSNALAGRVADAQKNLAVLMQIDPAQRVSAFPKRLFRRSEDYTKMVDGLRIAGMPE